MKCCYSKEKDYVENTINDLLFIRLSIIMQM